MTFFSYITCMVLTWQVPEIEVYINEHSVFPSVNVWVQQWGVWKQHPCNSNARITFIFLKPSLFIFIPYLILFFILYSFFISCLFFIPYKLITSLSACINTSMHVWWGSFSLDDAAYPYVDSSLCGFLMRKMDDEYSFSHLVDNDGEEDGFHCHDVWRPWRPQIYQKKQRMMHLQPYWENWRNISKAEIR